MLRSAGMATLLAACLTCAAEAQLSFLDKVFEKVSDMNVSYLMGRPLRGNELVGDAGGKIGMHGVGFEVALDLGHMIVSKPDSTCLDPTYEYTTTGRERRPGVVTYTDTAKEVPNYPDSIKTSDGEPIPKKRRRYDKACNKEPSLDGELSFGYSQMGGFTGRNVRLQGSLENLPAIGLYAVVSTDSWVDLYVGLRTGLAQLKGFQAFPADTGRVTAAGSTWQIGLAPGISVGPPDLNGALFVEAEWMYRDFDDIQWTSVTGPVPPQLLRTTHLSTFVISIGGQFGIGKED